MPNTDNIIPFLSIILAGFILYNVIAFRFKIWIIKTAVYEGIKKYFDEKEKQ